MRPAILDAGSVGTVALVTIRAIIRFHDEEAKWTHSLTLIVQADEEMAAGRYREAGRLALEAADAIQTPEEADRVPSWPRRAWSCAQFVQRGRFESVLELVEERRAELSSQLVSQPLSI